MDYQIEISIECLLLLRQRILSLRCNHLMILGEATYNEVPKYHTPSFTKLFQLVRHINPYFKNIFVISSIDLGIVFAHLFPLNL